MRSQPRLDLLPLGLLGLLALLPPETRGHAAWAHGLLALLFVAIVVARGLKPSGSALALVLVAALGVGPWRALAVAPGSVIEPWALWLVALILGVGARGLPEQLRRGPWLPWTLAGLGGTLGLYAVYQQVYGLDALAERLRQGMMGAATQDWLVRAEGGRAFAVFSTPAALGGYLILTLPVTAVLIHGQRGRGRALAVGTFVLQMFGLASAVSATATAALLAAMLVAGLSLRSARRGWIAAVCALLILLAGVAAFRASEVWDFDNPGNPWVLRAQNLRLAAEMTADHPWTGVGPGGFAESYPRYRKVGDNETRYAHNLVMQNAAEFGVPMGLGLSGFFVWCFVGPWWRRAADSPLWWRGVALGLLAFAVHNLADFTAYLPSIVFTAAILRGWISSTGPAAAPETGVGARLLLGTIATIALVVFVMGHKSDALQQDLRWTADPSAAQRRGELAKQARRWAPW
ncbi:MAG: O-antigen ligase family protein, partial [Acidobacteriota bacterium]|nr:O-antigen ligase family protein [Acidobacteriota bacterium]